MTIGMMGGFFFGVSAGAAAASDIGFTSPSTRLVLISSVDLPAHLLVMQPVTRAFAGLVLGHDVYMSSSATSEQKCRPVSESLICPFWI